MDPDQTAPKGAVWSGSTLFAGITFKFTSRWQSRRQLLWYGLTVNCQRRSVWVAECSLFGSGGPRWESRYKRNWAHDCTVLHCAEAFIITFGLVGEAKVSCILCHEGIQLILAYSWTRPAVLAAGKGPLFHLLYYLFYLCSLFLLEMIPRVDMSLNPKIIQSLSAFHCLDMS